MAHFLVAWSSKVWYTVLMLILYNMVYFLFFICYLPILLIRGKWHSGFLTRLGIFPQALVDKIKKSGRRPIWIHSVSVGEVQTARSLIKELKKEYPQIPLIVSTVTVTGNKTASAFISEQDCLVYLPLDLGWILSKVISLFNPQLFLIIETEIWPNLITTLAKEDIPAAVINGRLSLKSFKRYKLIRFFLKGVLKKVSLFAMQTKEDKQRIVTLGADKTKVKVTGNMKFDIETLNVSRSSVNLGLAKEEKLLIAGSTHRGEEKVILEVYKDLIKDFPKLRLLIAPRHIERVPEIEKLIRKNGFHTQKVSEINFSKLRTPNSELRTFILDTIGQLKDLYSLAEIVFIGGSLVPHGGQNPIEPARFAKPVIFGPYMSNFAQISELFSDNQAAARVNNGQELKEKCRQLLKDDRFLENMGEKARKLINENKGSTKRNIALIEEKLSGSRGRA